MNTNHHTWPVLDYESWKDTIATVHLWTQIAGKVRLLNTPWINHSWHVTFYITPRGLSTGTIPYPNGVFEVEFNFIEHRLLITTSTGSLKAIKLYARSVADFYREFTTALKSLSIDADIYARPNEVENAIPFIEDEIHKAYDAQKMYNFWQVMVKVHNVFLRFRAGFRGKCSPVHFFWGAFDLAYTRFSGRKAPAHQGGAPNIPVRIMREAYSHEVSSCGFWIGNDQYPYPVFYAYCYPTPEAYAKQPVVPKEAFYSQEMGEFLLPYNAVQTAANPENTLLNFLQSTYLAAAQTGHWDRAQLECDLTVYEKQ